jgi:hypothetical protein
MQQHKKISNMYKVLSTIFNFIIKKMQQRTNKTMLHQSGIQNNNAFKTKYHKKINLYKITIYI